MKKDIHPSNYREVVFKDMSNDETFITRSTVAAKETIEIDGNNPLKKTDSRILHQNAAVAYLFYSDLLAVDDIDAGSECAQRVGISIAQSLHAADRIDIFA